MIGIATQTTKEQRTLYQRALNELTADVKGRVALKADGAFGPLSISMVKTFQEYHKQPVTGNIEGATQKMLDDYISMRFVTQAQIDAAAASVKVEGKVLRSLMKVESMTGGFLDDGRVKILYERHIFLRELTKKLGTDKAAAIAAKNPDICNKVAGGYIGGAAEWPRISRAMEIDKECAMASASYGIAQVMGFNFKLVGWKDIESFYTSMKLSEQEQLQALIGFIANQPSLLDAFRKKDWRRMAAGYNGSGYERNNYHVKLETAYNSL